MPRIWWCPTGPLAFLPIHAAGIYATSTLEAGPTLSDFAISSYIPNVRALTERVNSHDTRHQVLQFGEKKTSFCMVSELPYSPWVRREVSEIKHRLQFHDVQVLSLEGKAATVNQAIANMETHSCIHFACFAYQDTKEPLKSRFVLHDGDLELLEIMKKQLMGAELAYLSAPNTGTGDEKLPEEAVHLAAGMLAAGYRGVVATMWDIADIHASQVAVDFYAKLIDMSQDSGGELGAGGLNTDNAAHALHYATQKLRKQLELGDSAFDWINYVHFGL